MVATIICCVQNGYRVTVIIKAESVMFVWMIVVLDAIDNFCKHVLPMH